MRRKEWKLPRAEVNRREERRECGGSRGRESKEVNTGKKRRRKKTMKRKRKTSKMTGSNQNRVSTGLGRER